MNTSTLVQKLSFHAGLFVQFALHSGRSGAWGERQRARRVEGWAGADAEGSAGAGGGGLTVLRLSHRGSVHAENWSLYQRLASTWKIAAAKGGSGVERARFVIHDRCVRAAPGQFVHLHMLFTNIGQRILLDIGPDQLVSSALRPILTFVHYYWTIKNDGQTRALTRKASARHRT